MPGLTIPAVGIIVIGSCPEYLILNSPLWEPVLKIFTSWNRTFPLATETPKSAGPLSSNWAAGVYLTKGQTWQLQHGQSVSLRLNINDRRKCDNKYAWDLLPSNKGLCNQLLYRSKYKHSRNVDRVLKSFQTASLVNKSSHHVFIIFISKSNASI